MKTFPENISFKYPWRRYQKRILADIDRHLDDKKLHIVAPPGSGKTILGWEAILRINRPTLILVPTIAIQKQWIDRFCELFLRSEVVPDWISMDIRRPNLVTCVTYQGLHATLGINPSFISILQSLPIGTIVLDEAHHLRSEWWRTLQQLTQGLQTKIIALTATPPYDVPPSEWQRYAELNGPVDCEISVPELVKEGDLCPHQDYVYFTSPNESEQKTIATFRNNTKALVESIQEDKILQHALENLPYWQRPDQHLEWIYTNMYQYVSCLIYLKNTGRPIPQVHWEVIGDSRFKIPKLDLHWMEQLLTYFVFDPYCHFENFKEHRDNLEKRLRRNGVLEKGRIKLISPSSIAKTLISSTDKLNGILEIVKFEYSILGSQLRMVILADYIRSEYLAQDQTKPIEFKRLGVVSIFEKLRHSKDHSGKLGVLTGSVVILPKGAVDEFISKLMVNQRALVTSVALTYDDQYHLLTIPASIKHKVVAIVTQLFQDGKIEILIGTKSLLGEGWDAPAINALVLASYVGSFVMSNQMRGRAIRTQKENLSKTSNIWHLVCLDPSIDGGGQDMQLMQRRFRSFLGISAGVGNTRIENGWSRLALHDFPKKRKDIDSINKHTFETAKSRDRLRQMWNDAVHTGSNLVEEIRIPYVAERSYQATQSLYLRKTIAYLIALLTSGLTLFKDIFLEGLEFLARNTTYAPDIHRYMLFMGITGILIFGRLSWKTISLYIQHRDIAKDINNIGVALKHTLCQLKQFKSDYIDLHVIAHKDESGGVYCYLDGGDSYERSLFIQCLNEIINPIQSPRYILIRKSRLWDWKDQKDYHAVPEIIGKNKQSVALFEAAWKKWVGPCSLIYTRNLEGRKVLLRSRFAALSARLSDRADHFQVWQ